MTDSHIIFAGQSNALGFLNNGPAPYTPTARVQIWADTNADGLGDAWNYMLPGANTGTLANPLAWGPEVQFAKRWLADNPTGILWIVKSAKGETALEAGAGTDWSPNSVGEQYDAATTAINNARVNLNGGLYAFDRWDALMWMQGETDATDQVKAAAYAENVREFITESRTDWLYTEIMVGRIGKGTSLPYSLDVRNAQWNLDNGDDPVSGVHSFATATFQTQADGVHYSETGHYQLGNAFYDSWVL